jgi:hypothetical protein
LKKNRYVATLSRRPIAAVDISGVIFAMFCLRSTDGLSSSKGQIYTRTRIKKDDNIKDNQQKFTRAIAKENRKEIHKAKVDIDTDSPRCITKGSSA